MHQPKPETALCACGRPLSEAAAALYHATYAVYVFHRCDCGLEWTERRPQIDQSQPVSTDEVIDVYQCLEAFEGSPQELVAVLTA